MELSIAVTSILSDKKVIKIIFPTYQQLLLELCWFTSCICLTLHLIIYAFVPKLRNTPGKCLMSLSLSVLIEAITSLTSFHIKPSPHSFVCVTNALIEFYSFLAAIFWMNVMAYDLYKTFANSNSSIKNLNYSKNDIDYNYIKYCLYAWLTPAIIVSISLIIQKTLPLDSPYSPAYGTTVCGICHVIPGIIFFILPLSVFSALNVLLFILTAHKLKLIRDATRFATKSKAKHRLKINVKLVLVIGLTWIFGFLAMFIKIPIISYPSIILHGLHGTFIFVVFTVKKSVYRLIVLRIKHLCGYNKNNRIYGNGIICRRLRDRVNGSFETKSDSFLCQSSFRDRCSTV